MAPTRVHDWDTNVVLRQAVAKVVNGESYYKASTNTGIASVTIKKYYLKYVANCNTTKPRRKRKKKMEFQNVKSCDVFTHEQEENLMKCIRSIEYLFYGITQKECRILAYQMVVNEDLKIPEGWNYGMASMTWLKYFKEKYYRFMSHLEKPERMCTRAKTQRCRTELNILWEKKTVNRFYDDLEKSIQKYPELLENKRIYSLDEVYMNIYPKGALVDRELKTDLVTTCCIICADGTSINPVVVKPLSEFSSNEVPGAVNFTALRGRLTQSLFPEIMQHFVKLSHSTPSNPSVLIMDTDLCHLSSAAINLAKDSGVQILTIHTHANSLLQPLQGELTDLFNKYYQELIKPCMDKRIASPHDEDVDFDISKIVREAYDKAMVPDMIVNAFRRCGISPFDRDLFTDKDYISLLDQMEQTCVECRLRDDRSSKPPSINNIDGEVDGAGTDESGLETRADGEGESSSQGQEVVKQQNAPGDDSSMLRQSAQSRPHSSQELDKLKRRLIRSVARLIKEKKTEEEVWTELKKECGSNCKTLWVRMRSLTLKKLKRLLDADDRFENVPSVARMTLTDWLLYDLVLVHEKIDVINRTSKNDSKVLENLFALVQRFQIEGRSGDDLAEAWTAATVSYNSKGHQCSPMLMQRRWYQIKELTRHKMYKFWFSYRGNENNLLKAKLDKPTPLQRAIALRYSDIITQPFPGWDERIEQKLVIMPEEFEVKMRKKILMKPSDETVPDVIIVEKKIDTITVDSDSEFEEEENMGASLQDLDKNSQIEESTQTPFIVQVKTEPQDNDDDIDITEHSVYPGETKDKYVEAIERLRFEEDRILTEENDVEALAIENEPSMMPLITNVIGSTDCAVTDTSQSTSNHVLEADKENDHTQMVNTEKEVIKNIPLAEKPAENTECTLDDNSQESILIDDEDDVFGSDNILKEESKTPTTNQIDNVVDITSPEINNILFSNETLVEVYSHKAPNIDGVTAPEFTANSEICPIITAVASGPQVQAKMEMNTDYSQNMEHFEEIISDHEEDIIKIEPDQQTKLQEASDVENDHETITEANFEDDGIEFADDGIEYVDDHDDESESKEATKTRKEDAVENAGSPKFDLKLLMNPVVYTTKLDEMNVYKGKLIFETIDKIDLVDKIILESKPASVRSINVDNMIAGNSKEKTEDVAQVKVENTNEFDDDLFQNDSSDDESNIIESKRVKLTNSVLQKPRSRSYHPIQLCKNPDFNTRLKRLPIGFFSSQRNRVFLKACKPMTIDVSKAFESKLVDGTLYLKSSDSIIKVEKENEKNNSESAASILPSAVAVQSLMDTTDVDKILQEELNKRMLERNKTIKLPNISVVRQINQQLLIAEVAPIMAQVENSSAHQEIPNQTLVTTVEKRINSACTPTLTSPAFNLTVTNSNEIRNPAITNNVMVNVPETNVGQIKETTINQPNQRSQPTSDVTNLGVPILPMLNQPSKSNDFDDNGIQKQKKQKKTSFNLPSWITKFSQTDMRYSAGDDSLLTIDTLYKMLNTLDPTSVEYIPKTKPSKTKPAKKTSTSKITNYKASILNDTEITVIDDDADTGAVASILPENNTTNIKTPKPRSKRTIHCCWARGQIAQLQGHRKSRLRHKCKKDQCKCCCRESLRQAEIDNEIKILENMQNRDTYVDTIEEVVQKSRDPYYFPEPNARGGMYTCNSNNASAVRLQSPEPISTSSNLDVATQENKNINTCEVVYDVAVNIELKTSESEQIQATKTDLGETTVNLDNEEKDPKLENQTPIPAIRVYAANSSRSYFNANSAQTKSISQSPPPAPPLFTLGVTPVPTSRLMTPNLNTPNTQFKLLKRGRPRKYPQKQSDTITTPCSCRPNVAVDGSSSMLVVDGSNECKRHSTSRVSKETRIYLNRKHLSSNERPFFVGKNKILLTNIKPLRLQTQETQLPSPVSYNLPSVSSLLPTVPLATPPSPPSTSTQCPPPAITPVVPELTSLELPSGVQVILLHDGTISYVVDPDVVLTKEQINSMTFYLQAIQLQVNASGVTLPEQDLPEAENIEPIILNDNNCLTSTDAAHNVQNENTKSMEVGKTATSYDNQEVSSTSLSLVEKNDKGPNINDIVEQNADSQESTTGGLIISKNETELQKEQYEKDKNNVSEATNNEKEEHGLLLRQQLSINETVVEDENTVKDVAELDSSVFSTDLVSSLENQANEGTHTEKYSTETSELVPSLESRNRNKAEPVNTNNNAAATGASRNLLSDLMEMSGILEEDITPVQQEVAPIVTPVVETIAPEETVPLEPSRPESPQHSISAQVNETKYDLNAIVSFSELKYACDNNGLFFKLDLSSGLIVPINVCIQKTPDSTFKKDTGEVIDLTDEPTFTIDDKTTDWNITSNKDDMLKKTKPKPATVRTIICSQYNEPKLRKTSLLKKTSSNTPSFSYIGTKKTNEEKKEALMKRLSNNLKPFNLIQNERINTINLLKKNMITQRRQRKQTIHERLIDEAHKNKKERIEANIDLVDSDAPMEEEYLLEESSSDSDDEPLAKIAKKMRENDNVKDPQSEMGDTVNNEEVETETTRDTETIDHDAGEINFEEAIDNTPGTSTTIICNKYKAGPVPTQLMLSGPSVNQPIILNDALLQNESDEENSQDCILGV